MTISDLEHFKNLLYEREHNLLEWLEAPGAAGQGDYRKAQELLTEIREAMERVDNESFGTCNVCKSGVELFRLEVQPVTQVCLGCITDKERDQLEEELFLASKIHRALLPQTIEKIEGFEVAVRSMAARIVGGDYYDFLPSSSSDITRVIIGDTMGKGIPAGLLMSNVQGALRILSEELSSTKHLITRLNRWLCRNVPVTKFISLICLGLQTGRDSRSDVIYTNAGHCPAVLVRKNGQVETLEPTGGVMGVHADFEYEERNINLGQGDMLLLFTDGVIEAEDHHDEMFSTERLIRYACSRRDLPLNEFIDNLVNEVRAFSGKAEFADDFTIIALRKTNL